LLAGRDLCGIAQTGTGKTAAFALPILQRLSAIRQRPAPQTCRALVLSPTRELASQIADSFRAYGAGMPLSTAVVFGGVPIGRQRQQLARGVDILVATPGRLLDLIDSRMLALSNVQVLVLDEADRMLDLGFIHALKRIVKLLPRQRQTLLFSATMPKANRCPRRAIPDLTTRSKSSSPPPVGDDGRAHRAERRFCPERTETRCAGDDAARSGLRSGARVHPHQARRRPRRPAI